MARNSNGNRRKKFPIMGHFSPLPHPPTRSTFLQISSAQSNQPNSHQERVEQKATTRNWSVVAEVGVKTHTATRQTHICDLARLVWHKAPTEEGRGWGGGEIKTDRPGSLQHTLHTAFQRGGSGVRFWAALPLSVKRVRSFFTWGWAGRECMGTRRHVCASVQRLGERGQ